jgi:hypothetical protein
MNKIKTLYDVVQTMRKMEDFNYDGSMEITLDDKLVFKGDHSVFEGNNGKMKGHMKMHYEKDGDVFTSENVFDMSKHGHGFGKGHKFGKCHSSMHWDKDNMEYKGYRHGYKSRLAMLSFGLDMLNRLDVTKVEDGKLLELNVSFSDLSEDFQEQLMEQFSHGRKFHGKGKCNNKKWNHHGNHSECFEDFKSMEDVLVNMKLKVDENNQIKEGQLILEGDYLNTKEQSRKFNVNSKIVSK